jgi:hypothetical protein
MAVHAHNLDRNAGSGSRNELDDQTTEQVSDYQTGAAATTLWPDSNDYDGGHQRPDGRTRQEFYNRLSRLNEGVDKHTATGADTDRTHKVDRKARERRKLAETFASRVGLSRNRIKEAGDLAASLDSRKFAMWGGRQAVAVAVVQHVAPYDVELGHRRGDSPDDGLDGERVAIRREIKERLGGDGAEVWQDFDKSVQKVNDLAPAA